jgi:hypothetical protein
MNRFFAVAQEPYEATRLSLDAAFGMPAGETTITPVGRAIKDSGGRVLLAIRTEHCQIPEIASAIASLTSSGDAEELTRAQYDALKPQIQPFRPPQ